MFVQIFLLFSHMATIYSTQAPTHLLATRVGPCYEPQETIVKVSELSVTTHLYDSKLSGVITISESISNGWKVKATMQKCVDIRNIDSCDFYKTFIVVNSGCGEDGNDKKLYSTLFKFTTPKMRCPIQAGRYVLRFYPFNSKENYVTVFESKISTSVFGFTFRLDGYTYDNKKIFCVETYLQLIYKRNHNWINGTEDQLTTTPQPAQQTSVEDEE